MQRGHACLPDWAMLEVTRDAVFLFLLRSSVKQSVKLRCVTSPTGFTTLKMRKAESSKTVTPVARLG